MCRSQGRSKFRREQGCDPSGGKGICRFTMRIGVCAWDEKSEAASEALTPDARTAWALFVLSQSQWNVGMNGATGMRYEGVEACARFHGIDVTPRVFHLFQAVEARRLRIWADENAVRTAESERKAKAGK